MKGISAAIVTHFIGEGPCPRRDCRSPTTSSRHHATPSAM
jgi:hypothetical protein